MSDERVKKIMPPAMRAEEERQEYREKEQREKAQQHQIDLQARAKERQEKAQQHQIDLQARAKERQEKAQQLQKQENRELEEKENNWAKRAEEVAEMPFQGLSDEANRVRRNLLIAASIPLLYILSDANITSLNFLGIVIESLKENFIEQALLAFLIYHLVHFISYIAEYLQWHNQKKKKKHALIARINKAGDTRADNKIIRAQSIISLIDDDTKLAKFPFRRWCVIEAGLPIALALVAFILLVRAF